MIILLYLIYCVYHYFTAKTVLHYTKNEKNDKIIQSCPGLREPNFKPHFFLPTATLQLLVFGKIQGPDKELEITREKVNDEGVEIDWVHYAKKEEKEKFEDNSTDKPVILILPGVAGSGDIYVKNVSYQALEQGYYPVLYQNRFRSNFFKLPNDKYGDLLEDVDLVIDAIEKKFPPNKKIYAICFSLGANVMVDYLGTRNLTRRRIQGAVSIGNPYDMILFKRILSETIFDDVLLQILKNYVTKNIDNLNNLNETHKLIKLDIDGAMKSKSVKEFDECIMRRLLGYKSVDDYYRRASCVHHIEKVDVPLLLISSKDDVITSSLAIPYDEVALNPNVMLVVTDRGSHLCFVDNSSILKFRQWMHAPALEFINALKSV